MSLNLNGINLSLLVTNPNEPTQKPDNDLDLSGIDLGKLQIPVTTPKTIRKIKKAETFQPDVDFDINTAFPVINEWFKSKFNKDIPHKLGQTALHNKLGFDHNNSADLQINPDSEEGKALLDYFRQNNIPFRASRGREKNSSGKTISTGVHIHLGKLSRGIGAVDRDISNLDLSGIDLSTLDLFGLNLDSVNTDTNAQSDSGLDLNLEGLDLENAKVQTNPNLKTEIPLDYIDTKGSVLGRVEISDYPEYAQAVQVLNNKINELKARNGGSNVLDRGSYIEYTQARLEFESTEKRLKERAEKDTEALSKRFKSVEAPDSLDTLSPLYFGYKSISGLIDVMKNNPEELARITELVKAGKAAVVKNKNPDRLLKPYRVQIGGFRKEVPSNDEIIETLLFQIDPELVAANRKYNNETGRNLIRFSGAPTYTYEDGVYNFDIQLSGSAARQINAYARGGKSELDKEVIKIDKERESYVNELNEIDKAVKDKVGNREWMKVLPIFNPLAGLAINQFTTNGEREQFIRNVEDRFVLSNLQLLHNAEMLGRAASASLTKGFDSDEYLKLIEEDRKRQLALNEANELLPKPKTGTEHVFAGFGAAVSDTPKMLLAGRGLPLLVYLEHLHNGNREAATQAFSTIPMIASGQLASELTAESVRLANFSLSSRVLRQLEVRGIQGGTNVLQDIVINPSEYLNGSKSLAEAIEGYNEGRITVKDVLQKSIERALPAFATGAAFPVGSAKKSIGSFIRTDPNFYRDDVIVGPLQKNYQGYGADITGTSSDYKSTLPIIGAKTGDILKGTNLDPELLATRHNIGRGVVDRLLSYDPDNLLVYRQALLKNVESFEKKTNFSSNEVNTFKNQSDINLQNQKTLALVNDILDQYQKTSGQGIAKLPVDLLAINLIDLENALKNKTYLKEGLSASERINRENNLKMSIKLLDEALPDEVKKLVRENEQTIRLALRGKNVETQKQLREQRVNPKVNDNKTEAINKAKVDDNIDNSQSIKPKFSSLDVLKQSKDYYKDTGSQNKWTSVDTAFNAKDRLVNNWNTAKNVAKESGKVNIGGLGLPEGSGKILKLTPEVLSDLTILTAFHIEDFYRRNVEPTLERFIDRIKLDLGNEFVSILKPNQLQDLYNKGQKYYETNNADPFFSPLKQNVLEQFPNSLKPESVKNLLEKYATKNELDWTVGVWDFVNDKINRKEKITKDELLDVIERGQVKVDEVILSRQEPIDAIDSEGLPTKIYSSNTTKYDLKTYTSERLELEGGRNPKEVLLQIPIRKLEPPEALDFQKKSIWDFPEYNEAFDKLKETTKRTQEENSLRNNSPVYDEQASRELREAQNQFSVIEQELRKRTDDYNKQIEIQYNKDLEEFNSYKQNVYNTSHWSQENVVAHFRANERETTDGLKIFHSEEFQSDWNQAGRKEGYKDNTRLEEIERLAFQKHEEQGGVLFETQDDVKRYALKSNIAELLGEGIANEWSKLKQQSGNIPKNPFMENSWKELAFKRFLRMGIEMGKDGVSWTTTKQQQERYNKTAEGKQIEWAKNPDGTYNIKVNIEEKDSINLNNLSINEISKLTNERVASEITRREALKPLDVQMQELIKSNKLDRFESRLANLVIGTNVKSKKEFKISSLSKNDRDLYPDIITFFNEKGIKQSDFKGNYNVINLPDVIRIGQGYRDYDIYFVNLAKEIGKKFGAEYKVKTIETEPATYVIIDKADYSELAQDFKSKTEAENYLNNFIPKEERDKYFIDNRPETQKTEQVHYLEITPKMRDSLLKEGQPLYGLNDTNIPKNLDIGVRNKIVTRNAFDTARSNVIEAINNTSTKDGIVFNTGLNPEAFVDQFKLLYKGIKDFKEFSKLAINQFGTWIEPHLSSLWDFTKKKYRDFNEDERGSWAGVNPFATNKTSSVNQFTNDKTFRRIPKDVIRKSLNSVVLAQTNPNTFGKVFDLIRDIEGVTNSNANFILNQLKQASKLDEKLRPDVAEVLYIGNEEGKTYNDNELLAGDPNLNRPPLNAEQIQGYKNIREAQNKILDIRLAHELHYAYKDLATKISGTPEHIKALDRIAKINAHYKDLKDAGYITLKRNGNITLEAQDPTYPVGDDRRRIYTHAINIREAKDLEKAWSGRGYTDIKVNELKNDLTNIRHLSVGMTPSAFEELVIRSGANTNHPEIQQIREEVYARYGSHAYKIKRDFTRGYERTWENVVHSMDTQMGIYERSYFTNIGREEGMAQLNSLTLIKDDYDLYKLAKSYIEDATSPYEVTNIGRFFTKARQATAFMQLAYDNAQFWLNAYAQPVSQTYSYFARISELRAGDAELYFGKAQKLAHQTLKEHYLNKKSIYNNDPTFTALVNRGFDENLLTARMTSELVKDYEGGIGNKIMSNGFIFNRAGEVVTRLHAFSEAYLIGKERLNLSGEDLYKFMRRAVDATQGVGGTGENPFYVRKLGEAGKLFYQFQKFNQMWFENLGLSIKADMENVGIPSSATGRHLAGLGLIGGIAGLPLTAFSRTLYTIVAGKDPKDEFKKYMKDDELLHNLALYGLPSIPAYVLGTSPQGISRKVGITFPFLADTMDEWFYGNDSIADRAAKSIPVVGTATQMSNVFGDAYNKRYMMALEDVSPKAAKNLVRGIRFAKGNYDNKALKNRADNIIVPSDRLSNADIFGQILGITPAQITDYYDKKKYKSISESPSSKTIRKTVRKYGKRINSNF